MLNIVRNASSSNGVCCLFFWFFAAKRAWLPFLFSFYAFFVFILCFWSFFSFVCSILSFRSIQHLGCTFLEPWCVFVCVFLWFFSLLLCCCCCSSSFLILLYVILCFCFTGRARLFSLPIHFDPREWARMRATTPRLWLWCPGVHAPGSNAAYTFLLRLVRGVFALQLVLLFAVAFTFLVNKLIYFLDAIRAMYPFFASSFFAVILSLLLF